MSSATPSRRTRRAGGARRTEVLDHVITVVAERGYAGTRYGDVADASGVAVSTLQGYFGSREDMLIEAMRRATYLAVEDMGGFAARLEDPWQQLVAMVDRGLSTPVVTWRLLMEFWTAAAHDDELRELAGALAAQYRAPFAACIQRGIDDGVFRPRFDTDAVVEIVVGNVVGLLFPVVLGHLAPHDTDYRAAVLAQLAFVLGASAESPAGVHGASTTPEG